MAAKLSGQVVTFQRGSSFEIELLGDPVNPSWGPLGRDADHATVAMSDNGDIVVAYHTQRDPIPPLTLSVKQAEIAYFQFIPGAIPSQDSWTLIHRELIGSIVHDPLNTTQPEVRCERPDVIAVGDLFFVSWTRRYDRTYMHPNYIDEPARLECAWLERMGGAVAIYGQPLSGLGHRLDDNFLIRECTGVADAVVLKQPAGGHPTVGIAYPRQTDFGDYTGDDTRLFEMAFVTCTLNGTTVTSTTPVVLRSNIPMDGPVGPGGSAGGLVLPDLAPSGEDNAFWLAYEGQVVANPDVLGRIRLEYWKTDTATHWQQEVGKTFNSVNPMSTIVRRRPMVSALPGTGSGEEVSIAFNLATVPPGSSDLDIEYSQWRYFNGGIQNINPPYVFVNNAGNSDHKPVTLHGPSSTPYLRRVYFDRTNALGHSLLYYDTDSDSEVTISNSPTAFRAAVSYAKPPGSIDTVAMCYEEVLYPAASPNYKRIVIRVD